MADTTATPTAPQAGLKEIPKPPEKIDETPLAEHWQKTPEGMFYNLDKFVYKAGPITHSVPAGIVRKVKDALELETKRPK